MHGMAFHCHHEVLYEYVADYQERVDYIKSSKSLAEQDTRLRLFKMIPTRQLPGSDSPEWGACAKAGGACAEAEDAYVKAGDAYVKARGAYAKAKGAEAKGAYAEAKGAYAEAWGACAEAWGAYSSKYDSAIQALHTELCPNCPWDGHTIFPKA